MRKYRVITSLLCSILCVLSSMLLYGDVAIADDNPCGYSWSEKVNNSYGSDYWVYYTCSLSEHETVYRSNGYGQHNVIIKHKCYNDRYNRWGNKEETIAVEDHAPEPISGYPASCTVSGRTEGSKCAFCKTILVAQETIPIKGHTRVIDQYLAPTCTEDGHTVGAHCLECGLVIQAYEVLPATGHTVVEDSAVAPTCTDTGLTSGSHCSVCKATIVEQK